MSQINAGTTASLTASAGSITDSNGNTNNVTATTLVAAAANLIGNANDNVLLDPGGSGFDALETAVSNLTVSTTGADSDIAINNSIGSTLTVTSAIPDSDGSGTLWIKNDNGLTVSAWTLGNNDNIALLATSGNITIPDGGAGVIDANGNLENADISVGTGKVRLEAAAGFVQDSAAGALAIAASDLLIKADQLNSETDATDIGSITTDFVPHLAVNLSGSLDADINNASHALTIVGANDGSNHSVDLKLADLDGDGNTITTNGGVLTAIVLNGTGTGNHDDDDIATPTLHLDTGVINTENANISLYVAGNGVTGYNNAQTEGSIQLDAGTSLLTDSTGDDLGNIAVNGNVVLNGTVHANTGETIALWGPSADIIINSAMVGANAVTLNPGGFDVIFKPTGSLTVSGTTASLTISDTDELILESGSGNAALISVTDTDGGGGDVNLQDIRSIQMQSGTKITSTNNITIGDAGGVNPVNYLYMAPTAELVASGNVDIDVHHNESATPSDSDTYLAFTDAGFVSVGKITSDNDGASGGDVFVNTYNSGTSGNIKLTGDINANSNDVSLDSAGSISRVGSSSITSVDTLSLQSVSDLGASGSYLTFVAENVSLNISGSGNDAYLNNTPTASVVTIEGTTNNGDIRYSQTGADLNVGDVTGGASAAGLTVGTGAILLSGSVVNLDVDSAVSASGGSFAVSGVTTSVDIDADVNVAAGSINISTDGAINLNAGDLVASGTGTISLTADNDGNSAGDLIIAAVGTNNNEKIRTGSGTITVEGNNVSVDDFGILSTGTVSITATNGVFSSSAADSVADIEAGTLDIEAASVGQSGGSTLEFAVSTKVDVESAGSVNLTSTTDLPLGKVEITGSGDVVIAATGSITDVDGTTADDIVNATNLSLSATTGIGSTGKSGAIEIDATTLANVTNSTNGGVFLNSKERAASRLQPLQPTPPVMLNCMLRKLSKLVAFQQLLEV